MQECKDAEPDVLFVGDSMIQLMQQYEVGVSFYMYVCVYPYFCAFCHETSMEIIFYSKCLGILLYYKPKP